MQLTYQNLLIVKEALLERLLGARLANIRQNAPSVFSFRLTSTEKLMLDANGVSPSIYVSSTWKDMETISSNFFVYLKKEVSGAKVKDIEVWGEDRIIAFVLEGISTTFKPITLYLVGELIPGKSNILLLDADKKILASMRTSPLGEERFLARGAAYVLPQKPEFTPKKSEKPFSFEEYCREQEGKEDKLLLLRRKDKYKPLFDLIKRKKKAGEKKLIKLQEDQKVAKKHLNDGDYGNFIFMNMDSINPSLGYMDYYGEKIALDPRLSPSKNAEKFFKRAKKAKTSLALQETNLKRIQKELSFYENASFISEYADEETLDGLMERFSLNKETRKKNKKNAVSHADLPYFVRDGETTYIYGKNAKQNDFLSFHLDTAKTHTWIHVLNDHGAHLIIRKENATLEEIAIGCQLALLLSGKEDGDVMVASKKDVRKGAVPGEALVEQYESFHFAKIEDSVKALLTKEKRIGL